MSLLNKNLNNFLVEKIKKQFNTISLHYAKKENEGAIYIAM